MCFGSREWVDKWEVWLGLQDNSQLIIIIDRKQSGRGSFSGRIVDLKELVWSESTKEAEHMSTANCHSFGKDLAWISSELNIHHSPIDKPSVALRLTEIRSIRAQIYSPIIEIKNTNGNIASLLNFNCSEFALLSRYNIRKFLHSHVWGWMKRGRAINDRYNPHLQVVCSCIC